MPELRGRITTGLGEGSYYVREYSDRIKEKLGFAPFLGTLNVKLSEIPDMREYIRFRVDGFEKEGKEFYSVELIPAEILVGDRTEGCYIVLPEKTRHKHEIELVSEFSLREKLELNNGDEIVVRIT